MQGDLFLKINKRADQNKRGNFFLKINKRACMSIRYTRVLVPLAKKFQNLIVDQSTPPNFTVLVPQRQIKPHPNSCQYPLINYLELFPGSNNNNNSSNKLPEGKVDMEENRKGFFFGNNFMSTI